MHSSMKGGVKMICPVCGEKMKEIEKSGVNLDICPGCKGVWLDRGELERLMETAAGASPGPSLQNAAQSIARPDGEVPGDIDRTPRRRQAYEDHDEDNREGFGHRDDDYGDAESRQGRNPGRRSWLSNIFETFGGD
jgi:uncharacterized protein